MLWLMVVMACGKEPDCPSGLVYYGDGICMAPSGGDWFMTGETDSGAAGSDTGDTGQASDTGDTGQSGAGDTGDTGGTAPGDTGDTGGS